MKSEVNRSKKMKTYSLLADWDQEIREEKEHIWEARSGVIPEWK